MPLAALVGRIGRLVSRSVRYTVLAVGKVRAARTPTTSRTTERLLARQARVDVVEVADDDARRAADPGARVRVAARRPRARRTTPRRSRAGSRSAARRAATSAS